MIHIPQLFPLSIGQPFTHLKRIQNQNGEVRFDLFLWYGEKIQLTLNRSGIIRFLDEEKVQELSDLVLCIQSFNGFTFTCYQNGQLDVVQESTQKLCQRHQFECQNSNQIAKLAFIETQEMGISIIGIHLNGQGYSYIQTNKEKLSSNLLFSLKKFNKVNVLFYAHDENKQALALINDIGDQDYFSLLILGSTLDRKKEKKEQIFIPKSENVIGFDIQSSNNMYYFYIATDLRIYVYHYDEMTKQIQKAYEISHEECGGVDYSTLIAIFAEKNESSFHAAELICVYQKSVIRIGFVNLDLKKIIDINQVKGTTEDEIIQSYECHPGDTDRNVFHFCCLSSAESIEEQNLFQQNLLFFQETKPFIQ